MGEKSAVQSFNEEYADLMKSVFPFNSKQVAVKMKKVLDGLGFKNIVVEAVKVDASGTVVTFTDGKEKAKVAFGTEGKIPIATMIGPDGIPLVADLSSVAAIKETSFGPMIDMVQLDWVSQSVMKSFLNKGALKETYVPKDPKDKVPKIGEATTIGDHKAKIESIKSVVINKERFFIPIVSLTKK